MRRLPFFVYGTLKPGLQGYARFLAGRTVEELAARVVGAALYSDGVYPYLVTAPNLVERDDFASGYVVAVREELFEATLAAIDSYEDYRPLSPLRLYDRVCLSAETAQGPREVWTYVVGPRGLAAARAGRLRKVVGGVWGG